MGLETIKSYMTFAICNKRKKILCLKVYLLALFCLNTRVIDLIFLKIIKVNILLSPPDLKFFTCIRFVFARTQQEAMEMPPAPLGPPPPPIGRDALSRRPPSNERGPHPPQSAGRAVGQGDAAVQRTNDEATLAKASRPRALSPSPLNPAP